MSGFLNRDAAAAQAEENQKAEEQLRAENENLKLRVEVLEGQLEQYAIQKAQLEVAVLMLAAKNPSVTINGDSVTVEV